MMGPAIIPANLHSFSITGHLKHAYDKEDIVPILQMWKVFKSV